MNGGQFVSYAQHGEDVILWRAFGPRTDVFYVDVGAYHPTVDSVSRALYERGWRGINIEPQAERLAAFEEDRPEDINLAVAVGDSDGTATLTVPNNPGWASVLDPAVTGADPTGSAVVEVPLRRLSTVLAEHAVGHVDVLKVDVEGAEPAVVRGMLAGPVRPTVCVIEGVAPGVGRSAGDEAVALLVEAGYTHCLFDGLNHYLTIDDRLVDALSVPANPLDKYVPDLVDRLMRERGHHIASLAALATKNVELRNAAGSGGQEPGVAHSQVALRSRQHAGTQPQEVTGGAPPAHPGGEHDLTGLPGAAPPGPTAPAEAQIDPESRRVRRRATFMRLLRGGGVPPLPTPPIGVTQLGPALETLTPSEAVTVLYRIILGRLPEPEGIADWASQIEAGTPLLSIAEAFASSEEMGLQPATKRARVRADLEVWSSVIAANELGATSAPPHLYTPGSVGQEILVQALYEVALQRQPTADDFGVHVRLLAQGASRDAMVRGFASLTEARARLLGHPAGGLRGAVRAWRDRRTYLATFRSLVAAAEERRIAHLLLHLSLVETLKPSASPRSEVR